MWLICRKIYERGLLNGFVRRKGLFILLILYAENATRSLSLESFKRSRI